MTEITRPSSEIAWEIRVRGLLDAKWAGYFAPFALTFGENETILSGVAHDQAELFGALRKIRELGLELVSVIPVGQ